MKSLNFFILRFAQVSNSFEDFCFFKKSMEIFRAEPVAKEIRVCFS